ncbi:Predicted Zn-dependent protease, minimal metalloprotease (MMP)-like domain [Propionibacterium cyclohexanicum]|uniref:Predicted Zn-dependent protease, minimal metalloprotease (MMP)-like domain n=1 Tax=Propionibacterium cyclohexanicum TaxID=64702 RepID=A0A1H9Q245_9ACTN|nr:metallopeptidase family protein [Propionibacterium cyclohexanicum]SER54666.1 Predicted Zn-dependent protease, minimal metalloprotease (MMP)-like domain [Propionibacterium cyclohexanicum]
MIRVSEDEFWAACEEALAGLPARVQEALDNVAILAADEPLAGQDPDLLGHYEGIPLTEREGYGFCPPDTITLYRGPHERICTSREQVREQVRVTLIHEIGHYFGIGEQRLNELGWG